jgi:hypothetical protein
MMLRFIICVLFTFPLAGQAQRMWQPEVHVISMLGQQRFIPGEMVVLNDDTLQCSELKMYLGSFSLLKSGKTVAQWPLDYFLVDFSDAATTSFRLPEVPSVDFDEVSFLIGVDSLLQVDGPHGGALDPAKGMYWTWQNGYIYVKMEGTSSKSPESNSSFAWHMGGYNGALNAARRCTLPCSRKHMGITINWMLFMGAFAMEQQHHIMSPSSAAVRAMQLLQEGVSVE